jgi:hypothetical protein
MAFVAFVNIITLDMVYFRTTLTFVPATQFNIVRNFEVKAISNKYSYQLVPPEFYRMRKYYEKMQRTVRPVMHKSPQPERVKFEDRFKCEHSREEVVQSSKCILNISSIDWEKLMKITFRPLGIM